MVESLDFQLGELGFKRDLLELQPQKLGIFKVFSFHEVALEARGNLVLVHVGYKPADEIFFGGPSNDVYQRQWSKNVTGRIIARGRLYHDAFDNLAIDDEWDQHYHHFASVPKEIAEVVLESLRDHLKADGITFNQISPEVHERVLDKYWVEKGIRSFLTLEDYLEGLRYCPNLDIHRDLREDHPLEWKHGLYDNWPIALQESSDVNSDRQKLREFLLGKGYEKDSRSEGDLVGTCPVGHVYVLFDSYHPPEPYTFGVRLCPRDRITNRHREDDSPIWQLQAKIIIDIGEYAIDRNLPVFLPKTRPLPTFHRQIPANALQFGVE